MRLCSIHHGKIAAMCTTFRTIMKESTRSRQLRPSHHYSRRGHDARGKNQKKIQTCFTNARLCIYLCVPVFSSSIPPRVFTDARLCIYLSVPVFPSSAPLRSWAVVGYAGLLVVLGPHLVAGSQRSDALGSLESFGTRSRVHRSGAGFLQRLHVVYRVHVVLTVG